MPKRSSEDKIAHYKKKIERLQSKRRRRVIVYSDSSDFEETSDVETNDNRNNINSVDENLDQVNNKAFDKNVINEVVSLTEDPIPVSVPEPLDPELLIALGDIVPEQAIYGEDIHPDIAQRWPPILRNGLTDKDQKDKIVKEYATPQNCKLFRAPVLNPEIAAAVSEFARTRDKKIETSQQQLGVGLTAISRAITVLLTSNNKTQAIKMLSDASRILSDLHALETRTRIKSLTQGLEKSFLNVIQESQRDEMLFGLDLPDKIKASKAIEKQGSQIKKTDPKLTPGPSTSRAFRPQQGNWKGPSRSLNRGGRGGSRKVPFINQKPSQNNFTPSRIWNKNPRAGPRT